MASGTQGTQQLAQHANAQDKDDIKSFSTTVVAAGSAAAAAAAATAAITTAAAAAAAASASVTNPVSAAALYATAATAHDAAIASAAATAAAAAADSVPALVATAASSKDAAAADPGNPNLKNLVEVAENAVLKAFGYTSECAVAAEAAATHAAAALACANGSRPPHLEPGDVYISCNGIIQGTCKVDPWVVYVIKFLVGVVILGSVTFMFMKMFGKKGGK